MISADEVTVRVRGRSGRDDAFRGKVPEPRVLRGEETSQVTNSNVSCSSLVTSKEADFRVMIARG
jgi:hypothetical protein